MTSKEKKSAGPTSLEELVMTSHRSLSCSCLPFSFTASAKRLWAFSTMTMAPSTMVPMVMAIPPRDMILASSPCIRMTINAIKIPRGRVMIATKAERACSKKRITTKLTIKSSCIKEIFRLSTALSIRSPLSYTGTIFTPSGKPFCSSSSFLRTACMVARAFSP